MVRVYVPAGVFFLVLIVQTDVPEFTMDTGTKESLDGFGTPVSVSRTVPVNPGPAVIVTLNLASLPLLTVKVNGVAEIEKSPDTPSVTFDVCVMEPLVAL